MQNENISKDHRCIRRHSSINRIYPIAWMDVLANHSPGSNCPDLLLSWQFARQQNRKHYCNNHRHHPAFNGRRVPLVFFLLNIYNNDRKFDHPPKKSFRNSFI